MKIPGHIYIHTFVRNSICIHIYSIFMNIYEFLGYFSDYQQQQQPAAEAQDDPQENFFFLAGSPYQLKFYERILQNYTYIMHTSFVFLFDVCL